MIRGKAFMMIDPTKLMPGAAPPNISVMLKKKAEEQKKEEEEQKEEAVGKTEPSEPEGESASPAEEKKEPEQAGAITHVTRAKVAGRKARAAPKAIRKVWNNAGDDAKRRENVVKEVVMSEMMYAQLLTAFHKAFAQPILAHPGQFGLTKEQATGITKGLVEVESFQQTFSMALTKSNKVPATILEHRDKLGLIYRSFVDNYFHVLATLHALRFNVKFIKMMKTLREAKPPNLVEDNLLMIMQRMPVYELLLRKLAQLTPEGHEEHKTLSEAMEVVKELSIHADRLSRQAENATQVLALELKLLEAPVNFALYNPERRIIRKGVLVKTKQGKGLGLGHDRHVFLLGDILLWCTADFHYKGHVGLEFIVVQDIEVKGEKKGLLMVVDLDRPAKLAAEKQRRQEEEMEGKEAEGPAHQKNKKSASSPSGTKPKSPANTKSNKKNKNGPPSWVFMADSVQAQEAWMKDINLACESWQQEREERAERKAKAQAAEAAAGKIVTVEDVQVQTTSGGCCLVM